MSKAAWRTLVEKYADGRQICNCGEAYYAEDGEAWMGDKKITNAKHCKWGCSANQIFARDEIAAKVLESLPK